MVSGDRQRRAREGPLRRCQLAGRPAAEAGTPGKDVDGTPPYTATTKGNGGDGWEQRDCGEVTAWDAGCRTGEGDASRQAVLTPQGEERGQGAAGLTGPHLPPFHQRHAR